MEVERLTSVSSLANPTVVVMQTPVPHLYIKLPDDTQQYNDTTVSDLAAGEAYSMFMNALLDVETDPWILAQFRNDLPHPIHARMCALMILCMESKQYPRDDLRHGMRITIERDAARGYTCFHSRGGRLVFGWFAGDDFANFVMNVKRNLRDASRSKITDVLTLLQKPAPLMRDSMSGLKIRGRTTILDRATADMFLRAVASAQRELSDSRTELQFRETPLFDRYTSIMCGSVLLSHIMLVRLTHAEWILRNRIREFDDYTLIEFSSYLATEGTAPVASAASAPAAPEPAPESAPDNDRALRSERRAKALARAREKVADATAQLIVEAEERRLKHKRKGIELDAEATRLEKVAKHESLLTAEGEKRMREHYTCGICRELVSEPFAGACGHLFCKDCCVPDTAGMPRACPTCRGVSALHPATFEQQSVAAMFPAETGKRVRERADTARAKELFYEWRAKEVTEVTEAMSNITSILSDVVANSDDELLVLDKTLDAKLAITKFVERLADKPK